jgi:serine/threonine protein kinase/tetratricopeptide (TPR) repeat protein
MATQVKAGELLNERYELRETLGTGGMAVVYRARDMRLDTEVALKIINIQPGQANLKRFAREFRTLSAIRHPNCISVLDFGESRYGPFFTMELFAGHPITSLQGQSRQLLFEALYQLAAALEYVHSQGIIHRDIKPANILAKLLRMDADHPATVEVKLMDFGLARFQDSPSSVSVNTSFSGTIQYCAPEQFERSGVDHRADLYAFGLVCYELLAGRHPFAAALHDSFEGMMRVKLAGAVPPMQPAEGPLPPEVEQAVMQLLAREPADRPASAAVVRQVLGALLGKDHPAGPASPTPPQAEQSCFVGRAQEIEASRRHLHRALNPYALSRDEWATNPIPSILFITGDPGIGKSELQREVAGLAQHDGARVYEGRCFEGNLAPYQPFIEILRQLLAGRRAGGGARPALDSAGAPTRCDTETVAADGPAESAQALVAFTEGDVYGPAFDALLANYTAEILRIAPDLQRWLPGEAFRQTDLSREMHHVLRAVASFFIELATVHSTCLFLEDLQWADQGTLTLLQHVCTALARARERSIQSNASWPRLSICCTLRSSHSEAIQFANRLVSEHLALRLELHTFTKDEVRDLTASTLGSQANAVPEPLVDCLYRCCQGNPYFVVQMIRTLQTQGQLVRAHGQWEVSISFDDAAHWPDSIRAVLRTRLQPLSQPARQVLGAAAVNGSVIDFDVLRGMCPGMTDDSFLLAVEELLAGKIIQEEGSKPNLEFTHDLMRDLAYRELSSSRRHMLHKCAGEIWESRQARGLACTPEVLAFHFSTAGVKDKAFRYFMVAGEAALKSYAVENALHQLREAKELVTNAIDSKTILELNIMLATAYSAAGQPLRAISLLEEHLPIATEVCVRAQILARLGDLHFRVGNFDQAVEYLNRSLDTLQQPRTHSAAGSALKSLLGVIPFLLPLRLWRNRPLAGEEQQKAIIAREAYTSANYLWAQRNVFHCGYTSTRQWLLAKQIGKPHYLADAYGRYALLFGFLGLNHLARQASQQALTLAANVGDSEVLAIAQGHAGTAHFFGARFSPAEELLRQALRILDQRGDSWVRILFYHNLRHLYSLTGNTAQEVACAKIELEIGERVADSEGTCWGEYGLANALARTGKLAEAQDHMQRALDAMADKTNIIVQPTMLHTCGFVHLQNGDYPAAQQALHKARTIIEDNWAYLDYSIRTYPLLVESMLGADWQRHPGRLPGRDVQVAWRLSRRALFLGKLFPNYLPHAWRARGRAAFARGLHQPAVEYFKRAIASATAIGAHYDLARAHLDLAKVTRQAPEQHAALGMKLLADLNAFAPAAEA